ncbi:MAG: arylsulfatase, partial [Planctomycetota bacterium]
RMAMEGMRFTDAHSPSAVCTPTRYGLLTGRYCWRTRLKKGVLFPPRDEPLIEPDRATIASLLGGQGLRTACIGKWHLGIDWARGGGGAVDFNRPFRFGPTDVGFDEFFGIAGSLDMIPYAFFDGHDPVGPVTAEQPQLPFPRFVRNGPRSATFSCQQALGELTDRCADFITANARVGRSFFLYFPMTAPHKPVWPSEEFIGSTALGPYGDFIAQVDASVGEVLDALDRSGVAGETLVLFTSDNGSFMRLVGAGEPDHTADEKIASFDPANHRPNGPLRGTKADIWEAGHRVPFLARWPGRVAPGSIVDETICHVDVLATVAELYQQATPDDAADSYSFAPLLLGDPAAYDRPPVVHHSGAGMFAIRDGRWKLVLGNGSGGREKPAGKPFREPYQLYDLEADLGEKNNVAGRYPDVVQTLSQTLDTFRASGRSVTPATP